MIIIALGAKNLEDLVPNRIVRQKTMVAMIAVVSMLAVTSLGMVLSAGVSQAASIPTTFIEPPVLASDVVKGKLPPFVPVATLRRRFFARL